MSTMLQYVVPLAICLALLGIFHVVAYLHLQLTEVEVEEDDQFSAGL
jgi:hypothetical protein